MNVSFKNLIASSKTPFPYFVVDDFLSKKNYAVLIKEFHELDNCRNNDWNHAKSTDEKNAPKEYLTYGGGHSNDSHDYFKSLFSESIIWKEFTKYLTSENFTSRVWEKIDVSDNNKSKKKRKLRNPKYRAGFFSQLFYENYYVNLKLSKYPSGSGIAPHRDHGAKMISMLYFLGFSDGKERDFGGTQLYSDLKAGDWSKYQVDHNVVGSEHLELHYDIIPKSNSFAAFKRTENSWHSVNAISDLPEGVFRENLQVNFMRINNTTSLGAVAAKLQNIVKDLPLKFQGFKEALKATKIFFLEEYLIWKKNMLNEAEYSEHFMGKVRVPINRFKNYLFKGLIMKDYRSKSIRSLVLKFCEKPNSKIRYVVNYGLDISKLPEVSQRVSFCFGIYNDSAFEECLMKDYGFKVYAFDPTPVAVNHMQSFSNNPNLQFIPEALWIEDAKKDFYFQTSNSSINKMSGSLVSEFSQKKDSVKVVCKTLSSFKKELRIEKIHLVKMDIEGAALEVLTRILIEQVVDLPDQITTEIEIPKEDAKYYLAKVYHLFELAKRHYRMFYIPRRNRFSSLEVLMVKKD